jgi:hypothetical protein
MSSRLVRPLRSAALACSVALAACGDSGSLILGTVGGGDAASVRFTNATASTLDLAQSGVVTAGNANIAPGSSVGCLSVEDPTTPSLSVRVAGTATDLAGFPISFAVGGRYTVVSYLGPSSTIQFISIPLTNTPAADRSALRVFNGSSALSAVDVFVSVPGAALTVPIISSLNFGVASSTVDLAAGSTQIRLTTTGTLNVVFDAGTQVLEAGKSYTLVVSSATPTAVLVPDC